MILLLSSSSLSHFYPFHTCNDIPSANKSFYLQTTMYSPANDANKPFFGHFLLPLAKFLVHTHPFGLISPILNSLATTTANFNLQTTNNGSTSSYFINVLNLLPMYQCSGPTFAHQRIFFHWLSHNVFARYIWPANEPFLPHFLLRDEHFSSISYKLLVLESDLFGPFHFALSGNKPNQIEMVADIVPIENNSKIWKNGKSRLKIFPDVCW